MNVFELFASLDLDSSKYDKGLQMALGTAKGVAGGISKAVGVAGVAIGAASTAVAGFAATAVHAGASFDSSMSQVAATMGTTVDQIGNLRDFAQEMGATTAFSATQAADALNYMALAGYDANTSMEMLPNVLNLAAAGSIDLAAASDMVTDAQSALGLTIEDTTAMVDQMAKTSSKTNTSVAQLGEAFLTIGATARGVAGGTEELSAVLGVLADNGIKGAEGGTHLRNAILSLQTPTKDGTAALAQLGMTYENMYDEAGNMRSLPEIFMQMSDAMEGMTQQSKDAIISGIFNKADLASINALIGTDAERWNEVTTAIGDATGAAQQMADTQLDNLEGDITLFKSALEGAQIAISDELTPSLREFVQFGSDGLSKLQTAFKEGGLEGAMGEFGNIMADASEMIIEKLPSFVDAGLELLKALGQGMVDNAPVLAEAINGVINTIAGNVGEFTEIFGPLLPALLDAALSVIENLVSHADEIILPLLTALPGIFNDLIKTLTEGDILSTIIDGIGSLVESIAKELPTLLPALIEGFTTLLVILVQALADLIQTETTLMPTVIEAIVTALIQSAPQLISAIIQIIVTLVPVIISTALMYWPIIIMAIGNAISHTDWLNVFRGIIDGAKAVIANIASVIGGIIEIVYNIASKVVTTLQDFFTDLPEKAGKLLSDILAAIINFGVDAIENVINLIKNIIAEVESLPEKFENFKTLLHDKVVEIIDTVKNLFTGENGLVQQALSWGKDMIQGFIKGMGEGDLAKAASNAMQKVKDYMHFSEPDKGPLSDFHTYAPDMMKLFASGIEDNAHLITDAMDESLTMPSMDSFKGISTPAPQYAFAGAGDTNLTVPVYLGNELLDTVVLKAIDKNNYRTGGR